MLEDDVLAAWEFDRSVAPGLAARNALDRIEPPDMVVVVTASTGDTITVRARAIARWK